MSATNSCACSTSLLLPASSFMLWCAGEAALRRGMLGDWKSGAVVGTELDCLTTVAERSTPSWLLTILALCQPPTTQNSQQTEEHIQWQTPVTVMLIRG